MTFRTALILLLPILLVSCGTVSQNDISPAGPVPFEKPAGIMVLPFTGANAEWQLELSSLKEEGIKGRLPDEMAESCASQLSELVPTRPVKSLEGLSKGWLVRGKLTRVELPNPQAAQSKRTAIIECTVFIYDLGISEIQPFLSYDIRGKASPNLMNPTLEEKDYLKAEREECAKLLKKEIQAYMWARGWVEQAPEPR